MCVISLLNIGFFSILSAYAQITAATDSCHHPRLYNADLGGLAGLDGAARAAECQSNARCCVCAFGLGVLIYPLAKGGVPLGLLLASAAGAMWGAGTV